MQNSDNKEKNIKAEKTTATLGIIVVIAVIILVIAVTVTFLVRNYTKGATEPEEAVRDYIQSLPIVTSDGSRLFIDNEPQTEEGKKLYELLKTTWSYEIENAEKEGRKASVNVKFACPNTSEMAPLVKAKMEEELESVVRDAQSKSEIYNSDDTYKQEVILSVYEKALPAVCVNPPMITVNAVLNLEKGFGGWSIVNKAVLTDTIDSRSEELQNTATENLKYISKVYIIPESADKAPAPNQSLFGETTDVNLIRELLEKPYAQNLINGQNLCWNESIQILDGTSISYYLDESILMLQWQEKEAGMVGTFAEVFIADGSQLRRKIAGDSFGDMNFQTTSSFAKEVNAVLAVGGDFYNHARNCGIVVYNREIYRLDYETCDDCYITSDGDMLFSYRNQFKSEEEVKKFIEENDIIYSLAFGPVMIDNGKDMTPDWYLWGEINDTYARSALGLLGEHHYLTMNLNCGTNDTYGYATLRQASDAMIKRNCIKAYTLDGGQTATTAVNGVLKNPVQFGSEKQISDIIYFASAIPET